MSPPGTPVASISPSSAVCATSRRSCESKSAGLGERERERDRERRARRQPGPGGTVERRPCRRSRPGRGPASASARDHAGGEAAPRRLDRRRVVAARRPRRRPRRRAAPDRSRTRPSSRGLAGDHALPVDGQRQAEAVVVVGVVADQVHPARRSHPDHGRHSTPGSIRGTRRARRRSMMDDDLRGGGAAVVPAVHRAVEDDDVAGVQRDLAVVELEADGALEHDVEVRRRAGVHAGTRRDPRTRSWPR